MPCEICYVPEQFPADTVVVMIAPIIATAAVASMVVAGNTMGVVSIRNIINKTMINPLPN